MKVPDRVKAKLRDMPDSPGCYIMRDKRGRIIYVGKAVSLRKRVQSYFRAATFRRADPKLRGLLRSVEDIDTIVVRNEAEAILTEGRLIKDYRPRYNVSFKDDKRFLLLRADPSQPFPRFSLCRIRRDDGGSYLGPYASSSAARATLDFIEKKFGLRKCKPRIPDRQTYKHCLNDIIRYCSAPCIGSVSEASYHERFQEACEFLRGRRVKYLNDLREEMSEASTELDFEKAAALRDTLILLQKVIEQNARVNRTEDQKKDDLEAGQRELKRVLNLKKIPRTIEAYDISTISGTHAAGSMVCFVGGKPRRNRYRRFRIKTVSGSDDQAMMAEVIRRRFGQRPEESGERPDLALVDGGPAQLAAARAAMRDNGIDALPSAGLAKKFEELYVDPRRPPLRLSRSSPALRLLQQLRDEAHRFALDYHRLLRSRRIRESVLDDIPGIGEVRKKMLLERFGSARRLKKASEGQIAAVPGIGPVLAKAIRKTIAD